MSRRWFCLMLVMICLPLACQKEQINMQLTDRELASQSRLYPYGSSGSNYMYNYYLPPAGTSTPWWPTWSPDGKWLAFSMQGSIWKMQVGDTTAYELVHSEDYLSSPEWSPDGRYIAYTADKKQKSINLKLLDLQTETVVDLTNDKFV
ncbi:MAG: hypothetical protein GY869_03280, partial [Planctomycetes bacterium]|nr:hypothetical protein [Planctomycetota bacterium]